MASRHTQRHLVGAHRLVSARPRQPGTQRAGLTSKPHHAQRPQVALRGSFCLRLASTFNHRPARSPWASYARAFWLLPRDVRTRRARGEAILSLTWVWPNTAQTGAPAPRFSDHTVMLDSSMPARRHRIASPNDDSQSSCRSSQLCCACGVRCFLSHAVRCFLNPCSGYMEVEPSKGCGRRTECDLAPWV